MIPSTRRGMSENVSLNSTSTAGRRRRCDRRRLSSAGPLYESHIRADAASAAAATAPSQTCEASRCIAMLLLLLQLTVTSDPTNMQSWDEAIIKQNNFLKKENETIRKEKRSGRDFARARAPSIADGRSSNPPRLGSTRAPTRRPVERRGDENRKRVEVHASPE
jgi:hypothetical protein